MSRIVLLILRVCSRPGGPGATGHRRAARRHGHKGSVSAAFTRFQQTPSGAGPGPPGPSLGPLGSSRGRPGPAGAARAGPSPPEGGASARRRPILAPAPPTECRLLSTDGGGDGADNASTLLQLPLPTTPPNTSAPGKQSGISSSTSTTIPAAPGNLTGAPSRAKKTIERIPASTDLIPGYDGGILVAASGCRPGCSSEIFREPSTPFVIH